MEGRRSKLGRMLSWSLGRSSLLLHSTQYHCSAPAHHQRVQVVFHLDFIYGVARNIPSLFEIYSASNAILIARSVRKPPSLSFIHQPPSAPPWHCDNHGRTSLASTTSTACWRLDSILFVRAIFFLRSFSSNCIVSSTFVHSFDHTPSRAIPISL